MILVAGTFGIQTILSITCLYFLSKNISVELFGQVTFYILLCNLIALLDGMKAVLIFELNKTDGIEKEKLLSCAFVINSGVASIIAFFGILYLYFFDIEGENTAANTVILITWVLYFFASYYAAVLDGSGRYVLTQCSRSIIWSVVYVSIIFVSFNTNILIFYTLALMLGSLSTLVLFKKTAGEINIFVRQNISIATILKLLRSSVDQIGFQLAAVAMSSYDRMALNLSGNYFGLGLYSGSYELVSKLNAGPRLITQYFYPKICRDKINCSIQKYRLTTYRILLGVCAAIFLCVIYSSNIINSILGEKYSYAVVAFQILLLGFPIVVLGYFYNTYLNSIGNFNSQRKVYVYYLPLVILFGIVLYFYPDIVLASLLYLVLRSCDIATMLVSNKNSNESKFFFIIYSVILLLAVSIALDFRLTKLLLWILTIISSSVACIIGKFAGGINS